MADLILQKRGPVQRLSDAARAAYFTFFGPGLPLPQQAPEGTPPRSLDYPSFINQSYSPRSNEQISFDQLRNLADAYWLVRSVIETRKDQITRLEWHLGLKPKSGETQAASLLRTENDPRAKKLTQFFERPDGANDWQTWLRMIIEDVLVIDAATILPWRTKGGDIYKLVAVDGATIKPVLDSMGMTPGGDAIAYQQIIKGLILAQLSTKELVYAPRNRRTNKIYGFSPVEQLILLINLGIRRTIHQLDYYTEGTVPEAIVQLPESWSTDQVKQFQTWFDSALAGNLATRRRMTFVPSIGGSSNIAWAKDPKLTDEMDELLARATCFVFSIPPTPFVRQMNRATAQQASESAEREGLEPLKLWVKSLMNRIIQSPEFFGEPKVEFSWDDDISIDKLRQAQVDDLDIRNGKRSIDELRERDGYDRIGAGNGIVTANGFVLLEDAIKQSKKITEAPLPGKNPALSEGDNTDGTEGDARKPPAQKLLKDTVKKKVLTLPTLELPAKAASRANSLGKTIARFLKAQGKKISLKAADAYAQVTKADDSEADRILRDLELDWVGLVGSVGDSISETAQEAAKETLVKVGITDDAIFGLVNQDALDYAKARAAGLVGKKTVNGELVDNPNAAYAITETTRDELRQLVSRAFEEGMTPAELETAIRDSFQFSEARAEMIARTEMAGAHIQGSLEAATRSGVVISKYSMLGSEHDIEDECDENQDAGEIALGDLFPSGHEGPPFHPACVCSMNLVYEEGGK